jgi:phage terminase Nu1 subunit (DNA packaging protein)
MPIVSIDKVADALNLTPRRVQYLVKKEGLPTEGRGQYDPVKCMLFYIRYLQRKLKSKAVETVDGTYLPEREERVRRLRADSEMKELNLAERRKKLVSISDVERAITELVLTTKARLLAVPARVAPEIVNESSRLMIEAKIEKAIHEALVQLSKGPEGGVLADVQRIA